ncbi:MAG: hypothetical protein GY822_27690 [Deltaproteobacteria bacterium]|nr:hypothetical protein [Deltaproteobacteria bacterium]
MENGLSRVDFDVSISNFTTANGLPDNKIHSVDITADGVKWVGTDLGAFTYVGQ